jgi:hypothetical protein
MGLKCLIDTTDRWLMLDVMLEELNTWRMIITYGVGSISDEWHVDMMIHLFGWP